MNHCSFANLTDRADRTGEDASESLWSVPFFIEQSNLHGDRFTAIAPLNPQKWGKKISYPQSRSRYLFAICRSFY